MQSIPIRKNFQPIGKRLKVRIGPAGLHLFDRGTGTNILFDEMSFPAALWSSAPRQVSIALTNSCDLECPHCYAPKHRAILDIRLLKSWLLELDTAGCIGVGFGGGEPTLYPGLIETCAFAAEKTNLAVTMTTHAHHLNTSLLSELSGRVNFIRISMDGVGSTYESIRKRSFGHLLSRISAIKATTRFGINFVVNSRTIGDLDAALKIAEELGASEFLLLPEVGAGKGSPVNEVVRKRLKEWVFAYKGRVRLAVSESEADGLPVCAVLSSEVGLASFAHVDASGILKSSSYENAGIRIKEDGIMAAIEKMRAQNKELI